MSSLPAWAAEPIRQQAVRAVNTHAGRPIVDIRCGIPYRRGRCGRPLGGAWATDYGTIVLVNRHTDNDRQLYLSLTQQPEEPTASGGRAGSYPNYR